MGNEGGRSGIFGAAEMRSRVYIEGKSNMTGEPFRGVVRCNDIMGRSSKGIMAETLDDVNTT